MALTPGVTFQLSQLTLQKTTAIWGKQLEVMRL